MKLRTKFIIILLALTLILSGAMWGGLELYKDQQISQVKTDVNSTASLTADQINKEVQRAWDQLGEFTSETASNRTEITKERIDIFLENSPYWAARVIHRNGTVTHVRGQLTQEYKNDTLGSYQSDSAVLQGVLDSNDSVYITEPSYIPGNELQGAGWVVTISKPVYYSNRTTKGVMAAAIYVSQKNFFSSLPPLETETQTVDVYSTGDNQLYEGWEDFNRSISGEATVKSTGWRVVVTQDTSGLISELQTLAIGQGIGIGVILLLVTGLGYWQYANSLRQAETLLKGFGEIEQGNYEYSIDLGNGSEWVQISNGFNHLSMGLKTREERLRERQQRLEVMYRVLRHNLRNEMSIVQNYADIISDMAGEEPIRDAAQTILDAGDDLIGLSEKARQIENALQESSTDPTKIEASSIITEVVEDMREDYPDIDIQTAIPEEAWISAIPSFQLAIENLCENACKHNDADDPTVEVTLEETAIDSPDGSENTAQADTTSRSQPATDRGVAEHPDSPEPPEITGHVTIEIIDNGPGIPEQDRNVIQGGRETALEHGSGLGLWLVYWIVDKSNGILEFGENDPRGSIVTLTMDATTPEVDDDKGGDESGESETEDSDSDNDTGENTD